MLVIFEFLKGVCNGIAVGGILKQIADQSRKSECRNQNLYVNILTIHDSSEDAVEILIFISTSSCTRIFPRPPSTLAPKGQARGKEGSRDGENVKRTSRKAEGNPPGKNKKTG